MRKLLILVAISLIFVSSSFAGKFYPVDDMSISMLKNISKEVSTLHSTIYSIEESLTNEYERLYANKIQNICLLVSWQVSYVKDLLIIEEIHGKNKQENKSALQEIYYSIGAIETSIQKSTLPNLIELSVRAPNEGLEKQTDKLFYYVNEFATYLSLSRNDLKKLIF